MGVRERARLGDSGRTRRLRCAVHPAHRDRPGLQRWTAREARRKGRGVAGLRGRQRQVGARRAWGGREEVNPSPALTFLPRSPPRAFQTSRHRPRGGSNCLPAGPTDHRAPLVGGGGGREEGLGRAAPRRSQTVSFPAPKCSPENAGLRFIDSGDPGRPSALDRDSWERAAGPRGRLIHSIY